MIPIIDLRVGEIYTVVEDELVMIGKITMVYNPDDSTKTLSRGRALYWASPDNSFQDDVWCFKDKNRVIRYPTAQETKTFELEYGKWYSTTFKDINYEIF